MKDAAHGQITAHTGHIFDVPTKEAVFTDGDAVSLSLVKAKEDTYGVGLFSRFQITDTIDNQRTFSVLFEECPFVETLAGAFVFKCRLLDIRCRWVLRIGK